MHVSTNTTSDTLPEIAARLAQQFSNRPVAHAIYRQRLTYYLAADSGFRLVRRAPQLSPSSSIRSISGSYVRVVVRGAQISCERMPHVEAATPHMQPEVGGHFLTDHHRTENFFTQITPHLAEITRVTACLQEIPQPLLPPLFLPGMSYASLSYGGNRLIHLFSVQEG